MDLIRSLIFSQAQTAPEKVNHEVSTEEHVISLKNYRQNSTTEEDPLAVLRELRSTHEILPSELRDLGAETLEEAMEKAKVIAAGTSNTSSSIIVTVIDTSSNTTIPPPPFKRISTTTTTSDTLRFIPVPLGRPRSAEHIALLYQLCQKRAIQPEFAFEQHGIKYKASLKLGNVLLRPEEGVTYGTKKEAKEVLAKKGVELVKQWEEEDEIKQREADARGEGAIHGQSQAAAKEVKDTEPQENWVGMLLEYTQARSLPEPIYQTYQLGLHTFACTTTITITPTTTTSTTPSPSTFGSPTTAFASKKAAKASSARDAIRWLRAEGHLGASGTPPPRKKARHSLSTLSNTDTNIVDTNGDTASTIDGNTTAPTLDFPTTATAAHQVHTLSHSLGLQSPEYRFLVDPDENYLYSGAAWFVGATGPLEGPLGMVEGVFGKKAAREECAREVVKVLRAEIARRGRVAGVWSAGTDF